MKDETIENMAVTLHANNGWSMRKISSELRVSDIGMGGRCRVTVHFYGRKPTPLSVLPTTLFLT